jgi:predicted anti-sigma-YlaC factor YlaD
LVDALNNHIEFLHPNIHTIATAAAMSWAESFGSTPDSDDDEGIDVELAVNLAIASRKRFTWQNEHELLPRSHDFCRQRA